MISISYVNGMLLIITFVSILMIYGNNRRVLKTGNNKSPMGKKRQQYFLSFLPFLGPHALILFQFFLLPVLFQAEMNIYLFYVFIGIMYLFYLLVDYCVRYYLTTDGAKEYE